MQSETNPDSRCAGGLGRDVAKIMADRWLADAGLEHASIYAFLALARKLAVLGSPSSLLRNAIAAAAEESRHAADCLEMAARYDGRIQSLPGLPFGPDRFDDEDVRELVRESWVDGCIGEGLAAEMARARATECRPAQGRNLLATIAREERRHAQLGFDVLKFLMSLDGHRGELARDEFSELLRHTHAPGFMHRRDAVRDAMDGRCEARLGATFDRTIARGEALRRAMC